jgi:hypothetical protein
VIPVSIVSMMYMEHVLEVAVDWSTLPSINFGHSSKLYLIKKPALIPYKSVQISFETIQVFWTTRNLLPSQLQIVVKDKILEKDTNFSQYRIGEGSWCRICTNEDGCRV